MALLLGRYFGGNVGSMDAAIALAQLGSRRFLEKHLLESNTRERADCKWYLRQKASNDGIKRRTE
jgi:hypothetical protein